MPRPQSHHRTARLHRGLKVSWMPRYECVGQI
jgi:hypothetical protein